MPIKSRRPIVLRALLVVSMGVLIALIPAVRATLFRGIYLLATGHLAPIQQYLLSLGAWGPIVSGVLMVIEAIAVPVPVTLLMVANGVVFGAWHGMLISFVGGLTGAIGAYLIGRHLGRTAVERLVPKASLQAVDRFMAARGGWAVVIARWIPGVPCDPIGYAAGITRMPFWSFLLLTILGLLPANFATAFLGAEAAGHMTLAYWLAGLLLAVAVWLGWRLVRRRAGPAR
jgi:uncharacterized membrane protein YdjX (TVP38/TMEM64 family)